MNENSAFQKYHEALLLPHHEVEFARGFPDEIRDILGASKDVTVSHTFLQGSLARGTMVPPLKDGDMIVTLGRDRHGQLLESPNGPESSMDLLESVLGPELAKRYPGAGFGKRSAHAVKIELGGQYPHFDVVPAFEESEPPGGSGNVLIADRVDRRFEWSNPRELRRVVAEANQATEGRLIYVCRMVKSAIKAEPDLEGFPGLVVESLAFDRLSGSFTLAEGVLAVLEEGAGRVAHGPIFEPTRVNDLSIRLDQKGLTDKAAEWFDRAVADARRAHEFALSGDHEESQRWWYRVLGDPFPRSSGSALDTQAATTAIQGLSYGKTSPKPTRSGGE